VGVGKAVDTAVRRRSARSGHRPGSEVDARGPRDFVFFLSLSKLAQTSKLKIGTVCCSKNSQLLYVDGLGDCE
jgi:hypothetical protein